MEGAELHYPAWNLSQLVVVQQQLVQGVSEAEEGHFVDAVLSHAIVGELDGDEAGLHVSEHISRDSLDLIVVQRELEKPDRQEGRDVDQFIMGQIQRLQLTEGREQTGVSLSDTE